MILLVLFAACAPKTTPPVPAVSDGLMPEGGELFARHLEAIGGEASLRAHHSTIQRGTLSLPAEQIAGPMLILTGAPDLYYFSFQIPNLGAVEEGYSEGIGWQRDPMAGASLKRDDELDDIAFRSNYYADAEYGSMYTSLQTVGHATWAGEACWKVEATRPTGRVETHYFSEASGFRVGLVVMVPTAMGEMPANLELYDYEASGGVKAARKLVDKKGPLETILETTTVTVDDPSFALPPLPADVKALVDAR